MKILQNHSSIFNVHFTYLLLSIGMLFAITVILKCHPAFIIVLNDWQDGFRHPFHGYDHLITMVGVGIWAAQLRGQAIWLLPLAFVSVMGVGGLAASAGWSIPSVELLVFLSGVVFSVCIVRKARFSAKINVLIVAFFAFFHGYAHGAEISAAISLFSYTLGFVVATLLLHGAGIAAAHLVALITAVLISANVDAQEIDTKAQKTPHATIKAKVINPKNAAKTKAKAKPKPKKDQVTELQEMVVTAGRGKNLLGLTGSASQGEVGQAQFEYRPLARNGELVELIPGTIATQHSGSGKANQYFLRGYNLDHGTDFTTIVDGIPMNMPTNAHGQGYMDLNSLIPELVDKIEYGKGPYYAEIGDFSAAGYARMSSMKTLDQGLVKYTGGEFGYNRAMAANSTKIGDGNLLYGAEFQYYNGAWAVPENSHKYNGMVRYTLDQDNWGVAVNAKAYTNAWTATNQIPQSAIDSGVLGLYGSMNPSDGGNTNRYSFSTNLWNKGKGWKNDLNLYAVYYDLSLYSDFTGYLNGLQGDQVNQTERRTQLGGNLEHTRYNKLFGFDMDNSFGFNFRHDQISGLGLYETVNRQYLNTISLNNVEETTAGAFFKNQTYWHEKFRTIAAVRGDMVNNQVTELANAYSNGNAAVTGATASATTAYAPSLAANSIEIADPALAAQINAANSGSSSKAMFSPKLSLIFGPWKDTEYFVNAGYGYHSNDARGTLLQFNPGYQAGVTSLSNPQASIGADGSQISRVTPMAWARGGEIGARSSYIPGLNSTLALWWLQSQQELVSPAMTALPA